VAFERRELKPGIRQRAPAGIGKRVFFSVHARDALVYVLENCEGLGYILLGRIGARITQRMGVLVPNLPRPSMVYDDPAATLDDLREAVTTLEDTGRIAQRVLGGAHPLTENIELDLRDARAALRARETPSPPG